MSCVHTKTMIALMSIFCVLVLLTSITNCNARLSIQRSPLYHTFCNAGSTSKETHYVGIRDISKVSPAIHNLAPQINLMLIRGGNRPFKKKATLPSKGKQRIGKAKLAAHSLVSAVNRVLPATRAFLLLSLFCTTVQMLGLPAPEYFSLNLSKWYQIWRIITSKVYLGPPSMGMATTLSFLIFYGRKLEELNGTGAFVWFLLIQTIILSVLGFAFNFPFQTQSMISAIVYACSQLQPLEQMQVQFGLVITSWQLPYCMMLIDILSQQSAAAAWPHMLGIFSGHFYHFFTKIWPELGGKDWLNPPKVFKSVFDKNSNVGLDFRKKESPHKQRKIPKNAKGLKLGEKNVKLPSS